MKVFNNVDVVEKLVLDFVIFFVFFRLCYIVLNCKLLRIMIFLRSFSFIDYEFLWEGKMFCNYLYFGLLVLWLVYSGVL